MAKSRLISFKVTILLPVENPYEKNFLLVINATLYPILHRFQIIVDYWSNLRFRQGVPVFNKFVLGKLLNSGP